MTPTRNNLARKQDSELPSSISLSDGREFSVPELIRACRSSQKRIYEKTDIGWRMHGGRTKIGRGQLYPPDVLEFCYHNTRTNIMNRYNVDVNTADNMRAYAKKYYV